MPEVKNLPYEVLIGERDIAVHNLQANREYMSQEQINSTIEYHNQLIDEIDKRNVDLMKTNSNS